ncbi:integrase [Lactobacillus colini]|uniref:Integrase n=1 Tax=Lactobacillus colini TaxID=1819254 RepID=A0ABS4MGX4_9LACO|nr:site-specific integrase [Lactobacillus colini]MBP2058947.1 integrase [Lactobacillus colini]
MNINHNDNKEIKEYTTPSGALRYKFTIYLGKDELTGVTNQIRKQGFKSYEDALNKYNFYKKKLDQGLYTGMENKNHRFSEIYEMWLKVYKPTVRENTYFKTFNFFKNHILKEIGNFYIEKLNVIKAQQLINKWFATNRYSTACTMVHHTKRVFGYCLALDLVEINPFERVITPAQTKKIKKFDDYYSVEELETFLKCAYKKRFKWYVAFEILAHTGMRVGELLALNWSDVSFEDKTISISKTISVGEHNKLLINDPKTYSGNRIIGIDNTLERVLKDWRKKQRELLFMRGENPLDSKQLVLSNHNNGLMRINVLNYWNITICKEYNLRHIKIHGFRHTYASLMFKDGAKPVEVKTQLGHRSIITTLNVYTHINKEQNTKIAERFDNIVNF